MPLTPVDRLEDRFKVVFMDNSGARIRAHITRQEYERPDRDEYILNAYEPKQKGWETHHFWFVAYIDTFDTPSKDLEPGQIWEGNRDIPQKIIDAKTGETIIEKQSTPIVMWRDENGLTDIAEAKDVIIVKEGGVPDKVEKKIP